MRVAIASERDDFDGEVYRALLGRLLEKPIDKWTGDIRFGGCKTVAAYAPVFLDHAKQAGVDRALLAIDNDGGSRRRPEHSPSCVPIPFDIEDDESCRVCWLSQAIPLEWRGSEQGHGAKLSCIVVPVRLVETWLLLLRGEQLRRDPPEAVYERIPIKKQYHGKPTPPLNEMVRRAKELVANPGALEILRRRRSFCHFEQQVASWR